MESETCAHFQRGDQKDRPQRRNQSRMSTYIYPTLTFSLPLAQAGAWRPTRFGTSVLFKLPSEIHLAICKYLPTDSLHEMALVAVSWSDSCLATYCHEASKQSCGKLLQRALHERMPLQSFGYILELCPKDELTSIVRPTNEPNYDSDPVAWFGGSDPWLERWSYHICTNLKTACQYPLSQPFVWFNPIDMAAASGECFLQAAMRSDGLSHSVGAVKGY